MGRTRLEAFSDGVIAIIITIMVLELHAPQDADVHALRPLFPAFSSYALSFVYVGIYWSNHHHLLHTVDRVDGRILWANLHLLFWLSLVPFGTSWMGETCWAPLPTAVYGGLLLLAAIAYLILEAVIIAVHGPDSRLRAAVGRETKGRVSALAYLVAIPLALAVQWVALGIYVAVALMWLVPDRRIEARVDR